jgi:hypothetical protein
LPHGGFHYPVRQAMQVLPADGFHINTIAKAGSPEIELR